MVNFSKTDFQIFMAMVVFVVIISFLFPPMGFTSENVNATDIPEFNASQNTFSFVGEAPEYPQNPNQGTLVYIEGAEDYEDNRDIWLNEPEIGISMFNTQTPSNPLPRVNLVNQSNGQEWAYINQSEYVLLENWSYAVSFENVRYEDNNNTIRVDWKVNEQPSNQGLLETIPIVGGLWSATQGIAAVLGWAIQILFHFMVVIISGIANMGIAVFNIITFFFGFIYWLLSTYGAITAGAPTGWASVIMAIPGIILSFEFAKILILVIQTASGLIPTT